MKNLTDFNNIGEYNIEVGTEILSQPNVTLIKQSGEVLYSKTLPPFEEQYLTFIPLEDGQFKFVKVSGDTASSVSYSVDYGTTWTALASDTYTPTIEAGHKVYWKGEGLKTTYITPDVSYHQNRGIGKFVSTCDFNVEGNPASMTYGDDFNKEIYYQGYKKWQKKYYDCPVYAFYGLFRGCNIVNAANLKLTGGLKSDGVSFALGTCCYQFMFSGCSKLVSAPALPSLYSGSHAYQSMFNDCSSLVTAPTIAALNTNNKPANFAFNNMFAGCSLLSENIPSSLPYMWSEDGDMDSTACYVGMFKSCTSITTAPELPSLHIPDSGYGGMFQNCSSLNYIKAMFTTTPGNDYTQNWVYGVASTGTFVKNSSAFWSVTGNNGVPSNWTVQTASN